MQKATATTDLDSGSPSFGDKLKFGEKISYSFAGAAETFSFAATSTFMVFSIPIFLVLTLELSARSC
jgi:hypothetical protein